MRHWATTSITLLAALALAGCEATKSRNPLSPSVAGPIPGVSITAPKLLEPVTGTRIESAQQPLTLLIENASTTGERPLNYLLEVAADAEFSNRVFTRDSVSPGSEGRTSLRLPEALAPERTYYWRARAQDGANTGPYSAPESFALYTPVVFERPVPVSPVGGITLSTRTPTLVTRNASRTGPAGAVSYLFEMSTSDAFTTFVATAIVDEQAAQTQFTVALNLDYSKGYFWRVRAFEATATGPWSHIQYFVTPAAPIVAPTPTPTPTPTPPSGGYPNNGPAIIKYVEANWPSYLAAGVSESERKSNMAFLRDRIIETGICGGLDLGWNLKRGGPEISIDYLAWRHDGMLDGVDLAWDYDNTSHPLVLQWATQGPDYVYYSSYTPRPACK